MIVYFAGHYLPNDSVHISPDDRGFLFGDGVYEVVRAFEGHLFRAQAHWERLNNSLAAIEMDGIQPNVMQTIATALLKKNNLLSGEATVYLQVTRGVAPRKHAYPNPAVAPTIYAFANPFHPPVEKWQTGVRVITAPDNRWTRCDIKAISLLPNVMANQRAVAAGAHETIFIRNAVVTEGSHSNFCGVRDGCLLTHPANHLILNGITRVVVLELCRELNIPVQEIPIAAADLPHLDEAMQLGTTNDIMPIVQIDDIQIGSGKPGPITRRLQQAFRELVKKENSAAPSIR